MNEAFWKKLSAADQKVVQDAILQGIRWQNEQILAQEKALLDKFKAAGMTIIEPDVDAFRKAVLATVPAQFETKWGKGTWDKIQAVK